MSIWVVAYGFELQLEERPLVAFAREADAEAERIRQIKADGSKYPDLYHVVELELRLAPDTTNSAADIGAGNEEESA